MNIKLIIVWAFAIVIIGGIGLFGWMNQDILTSPEENSPYVPSGEEGTNSRVCSATLANGTNSYSFAIDEATDSITSITITYNQSVESLDDYTAANNIVQANINGATAHITGGVSDFVLILTINVTGYDVTGISNINADLLRLGIVVDTITDYNTYKTALNNASSTPYTCD